MHEPQKPQGRKLNRVASENLNSSVELKQKIGELMVLIESSQDSIDLVEDEIKLAADEICDRVSHFPKVFVERFHRHLLESRSISDVGLAVQQLNQDLEEVDSIYRSIPKLPMLVINWWRNHPQSSAMSIAAIAAFITLILIIPGSLTGTPFTGGMQPGNPTQSDR
jgi:hypothetical protein